jgi:hypothetical protein
VWCGDLFLFYISMQQQSEEKNRVWYREEQGKEEIQDGREG